MVSSAFPFHVPQGITDVEEWLAHHGFEQIEQSGKSTMAAEARFKNGDGLVIRLIADRGYWESHIVFPSGFWTHAVTAALLSRDERVAKAWDAYQPRASKAFDYASDLRQAILWIYTTEGPELQLHAEHARQRDVANLNLPLAPLAVSEPATPGDPDDVVDEVVEDVVVLDEPAGEVVDLVVNEPRAGGLLGRFRRGR